jgi:hypothetical protein
MNKRKIEMEDEIEEETPQKQTKEVIELTVTIEMLWSYWISRSKWPKTKEYLKGPYTILRSFLTILPDFFEEDSIKLKIEEYSNFFIYSLKIDNNFSYYYLFCNYLFSGEITKFFDGSYGEDISRELLENHTFMDIYLSTINKLTTGSLIQLLKEDTPMTRLSYHLRLSYVSELYDNSEQEKRDNLAYKKTWSETSV